MASSWVYCVEESAYRCSRRTRHLNAWTKPTPANSAYEKNDWLKRERNLRLLVNTIIPLFAARAVRNEKKTFCHLECRNVGAGMYAYGVACPNPVFSVDEANCILVDTVHFTCLLTVINGPLFHIWLECLSWAYWACEWNHTISAKCVKHNRQPRTKCKCGWEYIINGIVRLFEWWFAGQLNWPTSNAIERKLLSLRPAHHVKCWMAAAQHNDRNQFSDINYTFA